MNKSGKNFIKKLTNIKNNTKPKNIENYIYKANNIKAPKAKR